MNKADGYVAYLADGIYASFDGYQMWLRTGSHDPDLCENQIALDSQAFMALCQYRERLSGLLDRGA